MNLNDLESDERAELAKLYIAHLGETTAIGTKEDEMDLSPTRHFIKSLLEPERPDWAVLTDEEILSCLQVTLHGVGVRSPRSDRPGGILPPHYTAAPAFLDWLEDEKRGWPVLLRFLEYFEPDWYLDYLKVLAEADEDRERTHRADAHASMQGVAAECNAGRES